MKFKLGFTQNSVGDERPIIQIRIDGIVIVDDLIIDQCGSVADITADMKIITCEADIDDNILGSHRISMFGKNLCYPHNKSGDLGVQLRWVEIQGINLDYFYKTGIAYLPANYASNPDELQMVDGRLMQVVAGESANYVNTNDGWTDFIFETPIYNWLLKNNFGKLSSNLLSDWDDHNG